LPQDFVLLTGEREKNAPFSNYLSTNELDYIPVVQFLPLLHLESRGKLEELGIEIGSFDKESSNISFEFPMGGTDQKSKLNGIL
jgi:hypothetical protein